MQRKIKKPPPARSRRNHSAGKKNPRRNPSRIADPVRRSPANLSVREELEEEKPLMRSFRSGAVGMEPVVALEAVRRTTRSSAAKRREDEPDWRAAAAAVMEPMGPVLIVGEEEGESERGMKVDDCVAASENAGGGEKKMECGNGSSSTVEDAVDVEEVGSCNEDAVKDEVVRCDQEEDMVVNAASCGIISNCRPWTKNKRKKYIKRIWVSKPNHKKKKVETHPWTRNKRKKYVRKIWVRANAGERRSLRSDFAPKKEELSMEAKGDLRLQTEGSGTVDRKVKRGRAPYKSRIVEGEAEVGQPRNELATVDTKAKRGRPPDLSRIVDKNKKLRPPSKKNGLSLDTAISMSKMKPNPSKKKRNTSKRAKNKMKMDDWNSDDGKTTSEMNQCYENTVNTISEARLLREKTHFKFYSRRNAAVNSVKGGSGFSCSKAESSDFFSHRNAAAHIKDGSSRFLTKDHMTGGIDRDHFEGEGDHAINDLKTTMRSKKKLSTGRVDKSGKDSLVKSTLWSEECVSRRAATQKVRDHIKTMLLDNGWKIELRPRNGRVYFDSVYISPKGSSIWSITKAYDMLMQQHKSTHGGKKDSSDGSSVKAIKNSEVSSSFTPIPIDVLSVLRKHIIKRRTNKELEDDRMMAANSKALLGGSGKANAKASSHKRFTNSKFLKAKGRYANRAIGKGDKTISRKRHHCDLPGSTQRNKKYKKRGCALLVRDANGDGIPDFVPYVWKRTVMSWLIDLGVLSLNDKVRYMSKSPSETNLEGTIRRDGLLCGCCGNILSVSNFESHAGGKSGRANRNIYVVEAGTSLYECLLNAWDKQEDSKRKGFYSIDIDGDDPSDDTCGVCGDGGDLICCDACPSTFHISCIGDQNVPPGDWHCNLCSCKFCSKVFDVAAHEIGDTASQLQYCLQCEEKYHPTCAPDADAIPTDCDNLGLSFCGKGCGEVFKCLRSLLGAKNELDDGFSWTLVQRIDGGSSDSLLGEDRRAEYNSMIAVALGVIDECFMPILDRRSGINIVHNVVYNCGSNIRRLDYHGFYTFILEKGDEIISAACVRIHGTKLAEMPFIGTRDMHRRRGMCRMLLSAIELTLTSLKVEKLIIPAISDMENTWKEVFGFEPLETACMQQVKLMNILAFPSVDLLVKLFPVESPSELPKAVYKACDDDTDEKVDQDDCKQDLC